jgi:TonB family protein
MKCSSNEVDRGEAEPTGHRSRPALVARRDEPSQSAVSDLSNVVPFARRRTIDVQFPLAAVAAADRPAQSAPDFSRVRLVVLLAGSLVLHSLLLLMLRPEVRPLASIGVESISVEITLGGARAAGLATQSGEQTVEPAPPADERTPDVTTEATQETAKTETPQPQTPENAPADAVTEKKTAQENRVAAAPTDSAGGVGRGRSDASSNYDGLVAAHLQRHKRYPPTARKAKSGGVATVSFTIDGTGRVTSVELAQASGVAAFDQEVVAMVRRASPFPRPPDRHSHDFTVPVRFN